MRTSLMCVGRAGILVVAGVSAAFIMGCGGGSSGVSIAQIMESGDWSSITAPSATPTFDQVKLAGHMLLTGVKVDGTTVTATCKVQDAAATAAIQGPVSGTLTGKTVDLTGTLPVVAPGSVGALADPGSVHITADVVRATASMDARLVGDITITGGDLAGRFWLDGTADAAHVAGRWKGTGTAGLETGDLDITLVQYTNWLYITGTVTYKGTTYGGGGETDALIGRDKLEFTLVDGADSLTVKATLSGPPGADPTKMAGPFSAKVGGHSVAGTFNLTKQ